MNELQSAILDQLTEERQFFNTLSNYGFYKNIRQKVQISQE